jgi:hypothetical protein
MPTNEEVAEWMVTQIEERGSVSQKTMVAQIKNQQGEEFVYTNENRNPAISKGVLKEFGKLKEGKVRWDTRRRCWYRITQQI